MLQPWSGRGAAHRAAARPRCPRASGRSSPDGVGAGSRGREPAAGRRGGRRGTVPVRAGARRRRGCRTADGLAALDGVLAAGSSCRTPRPIATTSPTRLIRAHRLPGAQPVAAASAAPRPRRGARRRPGGGRPDQRGRGRRPVPPGRSAARRRRGRRPGAGGGRAGAVPRERTTSRRPSCSIACDLLPPGDDRRADLLGRARRRAGVGAAVRRGGRGGPRSGRGGSGAASSPRSPPCSRPRAATGTRGSSPRQGSLAVTGRTGTTR